jgi:hypothetical protein
MENAGNRYVLKGDEYLYLYVRFLYEIRKFGGLRRKLDLRNLPTSLFGEKVDKIISSFSVDIEQNPDMQFTMIISHEISLADILLQIKKKFSFLSGLIKGEMNIDVKDKDYNEIFQNCFDICELVKDKGKYYLVFMLVRNLENPQEMRAVEIYYPIKKTIIVDTTILEKLQIQAQAAKMKIEGVDHFSVDLTDLNGFFDSIGQSMQKFLSILNPIQSWHISAVRHIVEDDSRKEDLVVSNDKKIDEWGKKITGYLDLYSKGDPKEAEKSITKLIDEASIERIPRILARLYNDRGYIRYDISGKESAEQDLSMALQLHYEGMTVTLMNLSVIFIDEGNYSKAIDFLEKALFLTYGRSSISAGFLRLRLPENHFNFKQKWEQKPANVLEAAYTNLAFAVLKQDGWKEAKEILDEGLSLYPSSIRLKHAIARLYLNQKHADLADPIYLDLYNTLKVVKYEDQRMVQEVEMYNNKYNKKGLRRK